MHQRILLLELVRRVLFVTLAAVLIAVPLASQAAPRSPLVGMIWDGPGDHFLLLVHPEWVHHTQLPAFSLLERFPIPEGVVLKSGHFPSRTALEQYLLAQYLAPLIPAPGTELPTPSCPPPPTPDRRAAATTAVAEDSVALAGPPRIFIVLPSSGPAFMPVGIGGTNFDQCAIPYFSNTPSRALTSAGTQRLPLIGSISVGITIVPPAAPSGPGEVVVEYLGQRSNPFPFTKN